MTIHKFTTQIQIPEHLTKWNSEKKAYDKAEAAVISVVIEIDQTKLAQVLGCKAWRNKSKTAHEVGGLVRVVQCRQVT